MFGGNEDCHGDCSTSADGADGLSLNSYSVINNVTSSSHILEIWILSVIGAILVGLSGIFPLLVVPLESGAALRHGEPAKKLRLMLSFAVGSLLGDVFLHLLPEVWAQMDRGSHESHTKIGLWIITGLLSFMVIEKLVGEGEEVSDGADVISNSSLSNSNKDTDQHIKVTNGESHSPNKHKKKGKLKSKDKEKPLSKPAVVENKIKVSGYLNLIANIVDNFTHGLAVAASFFISTKVGLATTVAILLHEVPHEVGDFAILLRSGFDRWGAAKAQFWTASGGVIGALTVLTAKSAHVAGEITAWILPFTSGGFMYIALVTVVPDLLKETCGWESLKQVFCICLGVLSMLLVTILFET